MAALSERFSVLNVLEKDQTFNLPAGGFLLQGRLRQTIQRADAIASQASKTVKRELINKIHRVNINVDATLGILFESGKGQNM